MTLSHIRTAGAALCLGLLWTTLWLLTQGLATALWQWLGLMGLLWVWFGLGIWLIRKVPVRVAVGLILLGAIALPLTVGFRAPSSSDDLYRYIWDGRIQAQGIDPYRYAPAAPELVPYRDEFLWPEKSAWCVPADSMDLTPGCTLINRPQVHTIYPPVAQAYFAVVHFLSPPDSRETPIQLAATLFAWVATVLLVVALPRLGIGVQYAAIWAWCPLVALEAGNNAHLDVVGAFFAIAALVAFALRRGVFSGVLIGLAVATKITPVLVGPAMLRRRPVIVVGSALATVILVYLPHVLAVGPGVLGYTRGYLAEEGFSDGRRFALLTLLVPERFAAVVAVVLLAAVAVAVIWKSNPDRPWDGALVMTGVTLLVTAPAHSWYAVLLVGLVALAGRAEWLSIAVAGYVAQYFYELQLEPVDAQRIGYGAAALVIAIVTLVRVARTRVTSSDRER